jgi:hypothetical protein
MVRVRRRPPRSVLLLALAAGGTALGQAPDAPEAAAATAIEGTDQEALKQQALALWVGHVESDNIARTAVAENGSYDSVGVYADLGHTSTRLVTNINTDIELRNYSLATIDNETVGTLGASANFNLVRDIFSWDFRDNYSQGRRDQFQPIGPTNRESINVFSSGPQFDVALGGRTTLSIGGDYSTRRYDQSTSVDSDSVVYQLGLFRQASPTARIGIVANADNIDYVDSNAAPYDIDRLSLRYEKMLATGAVSTDIGTNKIRSRGVRTNRPLFTFGWSRSLTPRSALSITAARELTDSSNLVSGTTRIDNTIDVGDVLVSANPLEHKTLGISYVLTMARTDISFGVVDTDEAYVGATTLDNKFTTTRIGFHRALSPRMDLGSSYDKSRRDYQDSAVPRADDIDTVLSAWLSHSLGRRYIVALAWSDYRRRGSQALDESRYELRFGYSPTGNGVASLRSIGR